MVPAQLPVANVMELLPDNFCLNCPVIAFNGCPKELLALVNLSIEKEVQGSIREEFQVLVEKVGGLVQITIRELQHP